MPLILKPKDVAERIAAGETIDAIFGAAGARIAKLVSPQAEIIASNDAGERAFDFVISTEAVDRFTDTVKLGGWETKNFTTSPVVLWAHDDSIPAIGSASNTRTEKRALRSTVTFAEAGSYPLADTICSLVRQKILRAASVGFIPLRFKAASDPGRQFGLDILEQDLLEWSVVNIPANPECLVQAKSLGINTGPLAEWAERILDGGGKMILPRAEVEALRKAAKMPKAAAKKKTTKIAPATMVRGLFSVSELASLLAQLAWLEDSVEWEAEYENDGSDIPARLAAVLKELGQILVDMTAEEVAELFAEEDSGTEVGGLLADTIIGSAKTPAQKFILKLGMVAKALKMKAPEALTKDAEIALLTKLASKHGMTLMDQARVVKIERAAKAQRLAENRRRDQDALAMAPK